MCDDPYILAANFQQKIRNSPDYESLSQEEAAADLRIRIKNYERVYQTIEDESLSYIKIINLKSKIICNKISGFLPQMIRTFLMSLHIQTRPIWFTRPSLLESDSPEDRKYPNDGNHGQLTSMLSTPNIKATINMSGDSYARRLEAFINKRFRSGDRSELVIYTGTSQRASQTMKYIANATHIQSVLLNNLDTGICDGMTSAEIQQKYPDVWKAWQEDRFHFRFPEGESYSDVIERLKSFVIELESLTCPALVICNQVILQALYCYFKSIDVTTCPFYNIPMHTVIELVSTHYGWKEKHYKILT